MSIFDNGKMKIINANIQADLSECSIEEGLIQLKAKDKNKIFLLAAINHKFTYLFKLAIEMNFPLSNIDTSEVLERDSWLLIDHGNKKMYYSEGA